MKKHFDNVSHCDECLVFSFGRLWSLLVTACGSECHHSSQSVCVLHNDWAHWGGELVCMCVCVYVHMCVCTCICVRVCKGGGGGMNQTHRLTFTGRRDYEEDWKRRGNILFRSFSFTNQFVLFVNRKTSLMKTQTRNSTIYVLST